MIMSEISDYKIRAQVRNIFDFLAIKISESSVAVGILALAEVTARILVECPNAERITKAYCDDLMRNVKENVKNKEDYDKTNHSKKGGKE